MRSFRPGPPGLGNRMKGACPSRGSVREDVARRCVLRAIQEHRLSPDGIARFRKRVAEELRDYTRDLEARRTERVERLERTEEKIRRLIAFIATGDRSEYVVATLRDLEAFARAENAALAELTQEAIARSACRVYRGGHGPCHRPGREADR